MVTWHAFDIRMAIERSHQMSSISLKNGDRKKSSSEFDLTQRNYGNIYVFHSCISHSNYFNINKVHSLFLGHSNEIELTWWFLSIVLHISEAYQVVVNSQIIFFSQNDIIIILYVNNRHVYSYSYDLNWNDLNVVKYVLKWYVCRYIIFIRILKSFEYYFFNIEVVLVSNITTMILISFLFIDNDSYIVVA